MFQTRGTPFRPAVEGADEDSARWVTGLHQRHGYRDIQHISRRLCDSFRLCAVSSPPGLCNFAEFYACASRNQLVGTNSAVKIESLFARYDYAGTGLLDYKFFADSLLGVVPNGEASSTVRSALAACRRALAREGGGLALCALSVALRRLAAARGSDAVPRREAQRVLMQACPRLAAWDLREVLAECCRPHGPGGGSGSGGGGGIAYDGTLLISQLLVLLRGGISRQRRSAVGDAWAQLDPTGSGRAPRAAVVAGLGDEAASYLGSSAGAGASTAAVTAADFVSLYRDISAVVENDDEFEASLLSSFPPRSGANGVVSNGGGGTISFGSATASLSATAAAPRAAVLAAPPPPSSLPPPPPPQLPPPPSHFSESATMAMLAGATARGGGGGAARPASLGAAHAMHRPPEPLLPGSPLAVFREIAAGRMPVPYGGAGAEISVVGACLRNTLQRAVPRMGKELFLGNNTRVVQMPAPPEPFGAGSPQAIRVGASLVRGVVIARPNVAAGGAGALRDASAAALGETAGGIAARQYMASLGRKGQPVFRFGGPTYI